MSDADPGAPDVALIARLGEASALADEGQWMAALNVLLEEATRHPNDPTVLCMAAIALRETGAEDAAYDYFRRCLAEEPQDPHLLVTAGAEIARWDDPDAERVLRLAALTAPNLNIARLEYGAFLSREGHLETALTELFAARDLDPSDSRSHIELGIALLLAGRAQDALGCLDDGMELAPEQSWVQVVYGLTLVDTGSIEEGAEQLRLASIARPDDWQLHGALALGAIAAGWEDEAWTALARAESVPIADQAFIRDVEELIELGTESAGSFLRDELVPSLLRERLNERS